MHSNHAPSIVGAGSKSPVDNDLTASRFRHIYIPSLAHLFALLIRPPVGFWSAKTRLVVIDGLSTLFDQAYPRHGRTVAVGTDTDPKHIDSSATLRRRYKAAEDRRRRDVDAAAATLTCHLLRLASLHTSAVILTGDLVTKVRQWTGFGPTSSTQTALQATLRPASYGFDWDTAIATRLVLYHGDLFSRQASVSTIWREITHPKPSEDTTCRFLCVTKIRGIVLSEQAAFGQAVSFIVNEVGSIQHRPLLELSI